MEYKSEIIDFEKEDAESKKRMLGGDKVNIEEIKKLLLGFRKEERFYDSRDLPEFAESIEYLLSIIEQAEKALTEFTDKNFQGGSKSDREDYFVMVSCADIYRLREALQAIRK